jgi:hypothetical protein
MTTRITGERFASTLSAFAAGATCDTHPLGCGRCWDRARETQLLLDHLPLEYAEGWLHSPVGMEPLGYGEHAFCVLREEGEVVLIIDPMVGEMAIHGLCDPLDLTWELP